MTTEQQNPEVHSRIDRIEVTLTHAVDAIEKIARVVNKPQETKWGPILTAVSLLFVAGSGYTTLITMPLMERLNNIEVQQLEQFDRELDRERDIGRIEGRLEIEVEQR